MRKFNLNMISHVITDVSVKADPSNTITKGFKVNYECGAGPLNDGEYVEMNVRITVSFGPAFEVSVATTGIFEDVDGKNLMDVRNSVDDLRYMFSTIYPLVKSSITILTAMPGSIISPPVCVEDPDLDEIFTNENLQEQNPGAIVKSDAVMSDIEDEIAAAFGGAVSFDKRRFS